MQTLLQVFFAIFGVMDPVGNVPVFLTLTGKMDRAAQQLMARKAVIRAGVILVIFAFLGNAVLDVFHVSIESFRIAGGIVLVILGLQIVIGFHIRKDPEETDDISIVPLATPLIAGPGMITTVVILAKEYGYALTLAGVFLNLVLSRLLFRYAHLLLKVLGKEGALLFAKVMGLILVAIGIEFIRSSIA